VNRRQASRFPRVLRRLQPVLEVLLMPAALEDRDLHSLLQPEQVAAIAAGQIPSGKL
jgi:hypothetical protein